MLGCCDDCARATSISILARKQQPAAKESKRSTKRRSDFGGISRAAGLALEQLGSLDLHTMISTREQLFLGRWQTADSDPLMQEYVRRWCVYYVTTENFDRDGVHGLDPNHIPPRSEDAMPAPWRSRECTRYAVKQRRALLHASSRREQEACTEAKSIALGMSWAEVEHEAGIELLPLHRGPLATHPKFPAAHGIK